MSIRYDYGKTSKRFGFLDYDNVRQNPPVPGIPGPGGNPVQGAPIIDQAVINNQVAPEQPVSSPFGMESVAPSGEDTLSNDNIAAGRNTYAEAPEGGIKSPAMKARASSGPGGFQSAAPAQTQGGMKRPDIIKNEQPRSNGSSGSSNRSEAKARSQRFIQNKK